MKALWYLSALQLLIRSRAALPTPTPAQVQSLLGSYFTLLSPAVWLAHTALGHRALESIALSSSKAPGTLLEMLASLMLSGVKGKAIRVTLSSHKDCSVVMLLTIKGEKRGL